MRAVACHLPLGRPPRKVVAIVDVNRQLAAGVSIVLLSLCGCSREHYRQSADDEVYTAIAEKTPGVPNMDPNFSLKATESADLSEYPVNEEEAEFFGPERDVEVGSRVLALADALGVAVRHNRQYKNEKESLYLEALSLTLSRHRFAPIFAAGGSADYQETRTTEEVAAGIDELVTERQTDVSGRVAGDMLLKAGGRIAVDFTTDFFRYLAGDGRLATSSALAATLSQPLLRGAGYKVTMENLTQAERNLLYSLRNFTQFRQEFTVDVVTEYYRVLQDRDRVRNAWQAYQNFQANVKRETARYEEGLARKADLAELQESELTNEQAWINAYRTYRENLDRFKITLGLTTDAPIVLDDEELERLAIDETHLGLTATDAVEVALASRLDLQTVDDQVVDAERKIDVVANGLLPDMDLFVSGQVPNRQGATTPSLDFDRYAWSAGLAVDLPLDRKSERNAYRAALIQYERARRTQENAEDQIRLDVQNGWRNLEQAKRDYEISQLRVELSRSRVREQELLSDIGEGDAFDLVRAQNALTGSQNQLTSALINHTIIRLNFWRDLGLLYVTRNGRWTVEYAQDDETREE
jgi:outer membrane protein TolC